MCGKRWVISVLLAMSCLQMAPGSAAEQQAAPATAFLWWPGAPVSSSLRGGAKARITQGTMSLTGGSVRSVTSTQVAGPFTLSIMFAPSTLQGTTRGKLLEIGNTLAIWQRGALLSLALPRRPEIPLVTLNGTEPLHLALTAEQLTDTATVIWRVYLNGALAGEHALTSGITCRARTAVTLASTIQRTPPWQGIVYACALYPRTLSADAVADEAETLAHYATRLERITGKRLFVRATITRLTTTPTPTAVLPYRHALVTFEYQIDQIIAGTLAEMKPGSLVRVARWGVLGGQQTQTVAMAVGESQLLVIEPFDARPDLAEQYTVDTLPENFDLPYWVEVR